MTKSVVEAHPLLYHYTNATGLHGIVTGQHLRATNIAYLNDAEEHIGYFDRRLPKIVDEALRSTLESRASPAFLSAKKSEVDEAVAAQTEHLVDAIRVTTLKFNEPYIASFSRPPIESEKDDGVLSQWQAYGSDGGYAIVFETSELEKLLIEENERYQYQMGLWGDVEYYDRIADYRPIHPETIEREKAVQEVLAKTQFDDSSARDVYEPMFEPITALACTHKHRGFRQESEVRIVAVLMTEQVVSEHPGWVDNRRKKTVHFVPKNGVLVPYIRLFENVFGDRQIKLPIRKIIVGPHREKNMRRDSVKLLLERSGIEADVVVSEIPFVGR